MGGKKRRARSSSLMKSDEKLLLYIRNIKSDHPLWGYRRVWAYLRFRMNIVVGSYRCFSALGNTKVGSPKKFQVFAVSSLRFCFA